LAGRNNVKNYFNDPEEREESIAPDFQLFFLIDSLKERNELISRTSQLPEARGGVARRSSLIGIPTKSF
jgi:hypothetical protein